MYAIVTLTSNGVCWDYQTYTTREEAESVLVDTGHMEDGRLVKHVHLVRVLKRLEVGV